MMEERPGWPVLTRYDQDHLGRIGLPVGGVGTGTVSLGGRGNLFDWEITNRPAKGFDGGRALFLLRAQPEGESPVMRALEGVLQPPYDGPSGSREVWHGLPRFRECAFSAAYPLGQVLLSDPNVPIDVRLEAWNPLVPADAEASGIPVAMLRYVLRNKTDRKLQATICGTLCNYVANGRAIARDTEGAFEWRSGGGLAGFQMRSTGVPKDSPEHGTIALATTTPATSSTLGWPDARLHDALPCLG